MKKDLCIQINLSDADNYNWALKKFKRQCESFGISREYKKRKAFQKPSIKKKEKRESAQKRREKESRKKTRHSKI